MKSKVKLVSIILIAIALAAGGSHLLAAWLKIETHAGAPFSIGKNDGNGKAYLAGSSLAGYGIAWESVSKLIDRRIIGWGVAGGSPFEWEQFQSRASDVDTSFLVVSAYDLNEAMICDFRAQLVPLGRTVEALRQTETDWAYKKRALSQYPMTWLRAFFPTIGRSKGVMGDLRTKAMHLLKPGAPVSTEAAAGPVLNMAAGEGEIDPYKQQSITQWSESEMLRKLAVMGTSFQGQQSFAGPKNSAFKTMVKQAAQKGRTIVVVLPVSRSYAAEFLKEHDRREFEQAISSIGQSQGVRVLRLDQHEGLDQDGHYCDLVHMNYAGQRESTRLLLESLKSN